MSRNYCVKFVNLSLSSLGVFSDECSTFLDMMDDIGIDKKQQLYIIKKMTDIAIRATYYIFCCRNRNWESPDLMQFCVLFFFSFYVFFFSLCVFFVLFCFGFLNNPISSSIIFVNYYYYYYYGEDPPEKVGCRKESYFLEFIYVDVARDFVGEFSISFLMVLRAPIITPTVVVFSPQQFPILVWKGKVM